MTTSRHPTGSPEDSRRERGSQPGHPADVTAGAPPSCGRAGHANRTRVRPSRSNRFAVQPLRGLTVTQQRPRPWPAPARLDMRCPVRPPPAPRDNGPGHCAGRQSPSEPRPAAAVRRTRAQAATGRDLTASWKCSPWRSASMSTARASHWARFQVKRYTTLLGGNADTGRMLTFAAMSMLRPPGSPVLAGRGVPRARQCGPERDCGGQQLGRRQAWSTSLP